MRLMKAQTLKGKIPAKTVATTVAVTMMLKKALDARRVL
jgi:hypothetical protein